MLKLEISQCLLTTPHLCLGKKDKCFHGRSVSWISPSVHYKYCTHLQDLTILPHKPDVLSRVSAITFPSQIDYDCIVETQQTGSGASHPNSIWNFLEPQKRARGPTPLKDITAETVAEAFFSGCLAWNSCNFTTDRGSLYTAPLHPKPPKHHGKRLIFIHPGSLEATHVFLRRDMLVCRLNFNNPMMALSKSYKGRIKCFSFTSMVNGYLYLLIDANLPLLFLTLRTCKLPQTKNETPATVEPNATASTLLLWNLIQQLSTPTQPSPTFCQSSFSI
ncbi:hypothetical protein TNCV_4402121 [Trichonephila clavipes]|nr:hypothetical protein TNCV_4402121 [Trichonephila clavipes]